MSENEVERIKRDLEKHGFPLEIRVSHVLKMNGWNVADKYFFVDEETAKTREVDCVATKGIATGSQVDLKEDLKVLIERNLTSIRIVVECKKSDKPWVFHTTKNDLLSILYTKSLGRLPVNIPPKSEEQKSRSREFFSKLHSYQIKGLRLGVNFYEPFKNGRGTLILDAYMKVVKALRYDLRKMDKLTKNWKASNFLILYYPVIVFEGNLYEFRFGKAESEISPIEYLQLNASYQDQVYRIDVVTDTFFSEYLKYLDAEIEGLRRFVSTHKQEKTEN